MAAKGRDREGSTPEQKHPDDELTPWTGLQAAHHKLVRRLEADLTRTHGMALVEFDVLRNLELAGGSARMSGLAESAGLSRSGLTRVVDVLEAQRFVKRAPDPGDGRVIVASITEAGHTRLIAAKATHLASVRSAFLSRLSDKQTKTLAKVWSSLDDQSGPSR